MKQNAIIKKISAVLIGIIILPCKCFALADINKTVILSKNIPHIFTFDEKIINYKLQNPGDYKAEVLSDIFNTKKDLIVKPLKEKDGVLLVLTSSKTYKLNLKHKLPETEIAPPPLPPEKLPGMDDFDLDNPPGNTK